MEEDDSFVDKKVIDPMKRMAVNEKRHYIDTVRDSLGPSTSLADISETEEQSEKKRRTVREDYKPTVVLLTKRIVDTYKKCRPGNFRYVKALQNPRRILTKDSHPGGNFGFDNRQGDMILTVGDTISNPSTGQKYKIVDMLGQGTFGQVVKCRTIVQTPHGDSNHQQTNYNNNNHQNPSNGETVIAKEMPAMVAVKVVKNRPAYTNQAKVEIKILEKLVRAYEKSDPETRHYHHHVVHVLDSFQYHAHMCMVFELMSINLFELIKQNDFRGLAMREISSFASQILAALKVLDELQIVHCDIKPENILIENFSNPPRVKLVDFGSACFENNTLYTYIQSRFYRAPEVIIGLPYSKHIDIWSFGCIMIELYMGLPLFPGVSNHNQLLRIEETLGEFPEWMLESGKQVKKFYSRMSVEVKDTEEVQPKGRLNRDRNESEFYEEDIYEQEDENLDALLDSPASRPREEIKEKKYKYKWVIKSAEEYAFDESLPVAEKMKRYCKEITLADIILKCDSKRRPSGESVADVDRNVLKSFLSFITGLLKLDPNERTTVNDAIQHPFISSPTMIEPAASRRPSSFVMPSPALTPSLMSPGSFFNTPFSPPIRPGVPYPLAHDWTNSDPQTPSYNPFYREFEEARISLDATDSGTREEGIKFLMGESAYFSNPPTKSLNMNRRQGHSESIHDMIEDKPSFYDSSQGSWNHSAQISLSSSLPVAPNFGKISSTTTIDTSASAILPLLRTSSYHEEGDVIPMLEPLPATIRGASITDTEVKPLSISHTLLHSGSIPISIGQPAHPSRMWAPLPTSSGTVASAFFPNLSDANSRTPRLGPGLKILNKMINSNSSIDGTPDIQATSSTESEDTGNFQDESNSAPRSFQAIGSPFISAMSPRMSFSEMHLSKQQGSQRRRSAFSRVIPNGSGGSFSSSPLNSPMESRSRLPPLPPQSVSLGGSTFLSSNPNYPGAARKALYTDDSIQMSDISNAPSGGNVDNENGGSNSQQFKNNSIAQENKSNNDDDSDVENLKL